MWAWVRPWVVGSGLALLASVAHAGCSDPAMPGVDYGGCQLDGIDLSGVDLTGADLRGASFKRSTLDGAIVDEVQGRRVKFVSASLRGISFVDGSLVEADFTSADARAASFRGANLFRARFFRADLRGADLTGARLDNTDFLKTELEGATWADGETICGPGSVGRCVPAPPPRAGASAAEPARGAGAGG